jgi:hypothetical protein
MEPAQIIAAILGSTVLGGVVTKLIDWVRDARAGQLQKRRAEVDRAEVEKDKALARADAAEAAEDAEARWCRIVEEGWARDRRTMIAAGLEPSPYPSRKD